MTNIPPPIGVLPNNIWKERRIIDLCAAIERYVRHFEREDIGAEQRRYAIARIIELGREIGEVDK
jgi:hypothetical protein